jgi:hypothetical protein
MPLTINSGTLLHDSFTTNLEWRQIGPPGIDYSNDSTPALTSADFTGLTLDNMGRIINDVGVALMFTEKSSGGSGSFDIDNAKSGSISGLDGVVIYSSDIGLGNHGSITGEGTHTGNAGVYLGRSAHGDQIYNYGTIGGRSNGINVASTFANDGNYYTNITNEVGGTIQGRHVGIRFSLPAGGESDIDNAGTIKSVSGANAIATTTGGKLHLVDTAHWSAASSSSHRANSTVTSSLTTPGKSWATSTWALGRTRLRKLPALPVPSSVRAATIGS